MLAPSLPGLALVLGVLTLFWPHVCHAIYQDEAYSIDFAHSLVGTPIPRNTFFHRPNVASKATLLYTLGSKGILGAVNPRDGALVWRTSVNDSISSRDEQGTGILRAHESSTTVVTGFGSTVRAWDAKDGRLVWEWTGDEKVKSVEWIGPEAGPCDVIVLTDAVETGGTVLRLSGVDGNVQWKQPAPKSDYPLAVSVSTVQLYVTSLSPSSRGGYKVKVQTLDAALGNEKSQYSISSENEISSEASVLHVSGAATAPVLVWTDDKYKNLHINVLGNKHVTIAMINPYGTELFTGISLVESPAAGVVPHFLIQYNREGDHRAEVYHVDVAAGKAGKAFELPKVEGEGSFSASPKEKELFFMRQSAAEAVLVSSTSNKVVEKWTIERSASVVSSDSIMHSVSELAPKGDGHYSVRTAAVTSDGDWALYQNGIHAWTRHEGLSGVVAAAFVEIPPEESLIEALSVEGHSNPISAYLHRVQRHIKDLRYLPAWIQNVPTRFIGSLTGLDIAPTSSPLQYDSYGFKKVIVVATERGRLAALGSANQGQVVWSIQVPQAADGKTWDVRRIDVQGSTLQVLAAQGEVLLVDGITGSILQHIPTSQNIDYHVPVTGLDGRRILLAISADGTPGILPEDFPTTAHLVTQRPDGTVAGWRPTANGKTALTWTFTPKAGETVDSITVRPMHDPVASIGRAGGDRSVLYKFLSPNLALVTASSLVLSSLSVYLLDTVSGQILYTTTHSHVSLADTIPVTFSENWFAYSLFTDVPASDPSDPDAPTSIKAYQLIVSELFESPFANDRGPLGSALNYSSLTHTPRPHVQSAAYVVPAPLSALATTSTLQGITPRALLAYSAPLAALLALPVPLLSPRRPVNRDPTPSEREEGLMKYQAHLDFAPTWYLTHEREILGVKDVISCPTNMESSSLVFAYGDVDLFGTRVSPIGTFDILGEGFGKLQLVLTVVGLAVGTSLLAPMAKRKSVDVLWRS